MRVQLLICGWLAAVLCSGCSTVTSLAQNINSILTDTARPIDATLTQFSGADRNGARYAQAPEAHPAPPPASINAAPASDGIVKTASVKPVTVVAEASDLRWAHCDDIVQQFEQLKRLKAAGALTDAEYKSRRQLLLDKQ